MTLNFPGPNQVRLYYTVSSRPHVMNLNCEDVSGSPAGSPMSDFDFATRGGGTVQANTAITAWVALIDDMFNSTNTNFTHAELWSYTPGTNDAAFLSVQTLGTPGAVGTTLVPAAQGRMSFITQEGGTMFIDFLEHIYQPGVTDPYPFAVSGPNDVANFVISTASWIKARDTSYPIAARNWLVGQSEALFKKIYRP